MAGSRQVPVRRVYEEPSPADGVRVLVDRIWPRGLTKRESALDEWLKEVAPSTELRKWYGHRPERFAEFRDRYERELEAPERAQALERLRELAARPAGLTLLTATKDIAHSHATVLAELVT